MLEGESGRRAVIIVGLLVAGVVALAAIGAVFGESTAGADAATHAASDGGDQSTSADVTPHIGQVDVDVQTDFGQRNNIGFDVETVFEDTATLTVVVSDGEASARRSFEGTTTAGTTQEFNDDINPPSTFRDDERFAVTFVLTVDGEVVDEKRVVRTYAE